MPRLSALHDKAILADFLRHNDPYLHVYALGDLDDFFWPYTQWYGLFEEKTLCATALLYMGQDPPTVLLFHSDLAKLRTLTERLLPFLPRSFYLHLTPGAEDILAPHYHLQDHGRYLKLGLTEPDSVRAVDTKDVSALTKQDLAAIQALYAASYPGHWFDPRMLETGQYFGVWQDGSLQSIAGIHVYSPTYRAAALGNITTHPSARGRGLAYRTTARLCQSLLHHTETIALNVKADNHIALALYQRLGFTCIAPYHEYTVTTLGTNLSR